MYPSKTQTPRPFGASFRSRWRGGWRRGFQRTSETDCCRCREGCSGEPRLRHFYSAVAATLRGIDACNRANAIPKSAVPAVHNAWESPRNDDVGGAFDANYGFCVQRGAKLCLERFFEVAQVRFRGCARLRHIRQHVCDGHTFRAGATLSPCARRHRPHQSTSPRK